MEESPVLSQQFRVPVYLKLEFLQTTGSFKLRGAFFSLLNTSPEIRLKGVGTCSAGNHGWALAFAGQEEEAIRRAREVPRAWPEWHQRRLHVINTYSILGKWGEASEVFQTWRAEDPDGIWSPSLLGWGGMVLGLAGHTADAEEILAELLERRDAGDWVPSESFAWVCLGLGRLDEAVDFLDQAFRAGEPGLALINLGPFEPLRGNPRFEAIRSRVFGEYVVR